MAKKDLQTRLRRDENEIQALLYIIGLIVIGVIAGGWYLYTNFQTNLKTLSQSLRSAVVSEPSATPTPTIAIVSSPPAQSVINQSPAVKEYFVPLGSGTSQASDWTDVPGVQAQIDFGKYPNIKEIRFEASVQVPTANETVSVRLYNVTDKHPVWYSDVSMDGPAASLVSSPIVYDLGEKTYQVQMKTQLQATANLVQSRVHIILR